MTEEQLNSIKDILVEQASKGSIEDNNDEILVVDDYAGGNIDDAYSLGTDSGRISLARELCDILGFEYTIPE